MSIIKVGLDIPINKTFDYLALNATVSDIGRGVTVPFGKRKVIGIILGVAENSDITDNKIKEAEHIHRELLPLDQHLLSIFEFCSIYYHHPIGEVALNALPPGLRNFKPVLTRKSPSKLVRLTEAGKNIDINVLRKKSVKRRLLATLQERQVLNRTEVKNLSASALHLLSDLEREGVINIETVSSFIETSSAPEIHSPVLNAEQFSVMQNILNAGGKFNVFLLYGITGSGKTEVYLNLIAKTLQDNKQVLVLVPEINLTPQLENIFRNRFPQIPQICLHSYLSKGERTSNYLAAQSGEAKIILSTRLGVFTPLPDLGLIIVDEEHDSSFKQQDGLRYSARDVAIYRAKLLDIPIVLGSATPSLESYQNALMHRFQLLTLKERAVPNATLPTVELIATKKKESGISEEIITAIRQRIARQEQSLIFINRRGYAPVLLCTQCHWISTCPRCSSKLTLHLRQKLLRCHHCGYDTTIPQHCPSCGNQDLRAIGQGTQRVETLLRETLPDARILRVDRDTVATKRQLTNFIDEVRNRRVDVLIGTQMLAKGHDFPSLTLVAVINADASLYSGDFRAEENLFSQLMQVSGRAGRAQLPGQVLVQTAFPEHPLFAALKNHDFEQFAKYQLHVRKENNFPPYTYQALLRVESIDENLAKEFIQQAKKNVPPPLKGLRVFDAVPAPLFRLANRFRWQLLAQSETRPMLQQFLHEWRSKLENISSHKIRWSIDVDPIDF